MLERRSVRDHRGHHPWRFIGHFDDWKIEFTDDLPSGRWGLTQHLDKRILIHHDLDQAERRSTLAHETGHMLRGPRSVCRRLYEESLVERHAARLLMPSVRRIGHALAWAGAGHELAAELLWVDERLLHARLSTLAPAERAWLDDQLASILI
jgi:hypothetical protein